MAAYFSTSPNSQAHASSFPNCRLFIAVAPDAFRSSADSDEVARAFQDDVARRSDMMRRPHMTRVDPRANRLARTAKLYLAN
jgi:hypothetical protein